MHYFYFAFSRKISIVKNISSEHSDSGSTRAAAACRPTTKPSHPRTSRCPTPPEILPDFASTNHQPLPYVQASPQHHQHACILCPTTALRKLPWQSCPRLCLPGSRPSAWRLTPTWAWTLRWVPTPWGTSVNTLLRAWQSWRSTRSRSAFWLKFL